MAWDHNYRPLKEGEIILATDDCQNDDGSWSPTKHCVGQPAPSPHYTSHRVYRRAKGAAVAAPDTGPYKACHTSKDDAPYLYSVEGPSDGIGYHAWYGNPQNTFTDMEDAAKAARLMNLAYAAGLRERSRQIRELIE